MVNLKKCFSLLVVMASAILAISLLSACAEQEVGNQASQEAAAPRVSEHLTVYKSPTCGCCGEWVEHVEAAGFRSTTEHPEDLSGLKDKLGVPQNLRSCHTAVSKQGYVFEGHIPARYIQAFLENPPKDSLGLSVPGMPVGSPGMEVDDKFMPYKVFSLQADGSTEVYASIDSPDMQY